MTGKGFRPGRSGNPRGRRPGVPNKATREVRELARRLVEDPDYQASVQRRLKAGEAGPLEPLLWHYAYGKPKEVVDLTTTGVSIVWESPIDPRGFRGHSGLEPAARVSGGPLPLPGGDDDDEDGGGGGEEDG